MVQEVEGLSVELETVLLRGSTRERGRRGPVAATDTHHSDLRTARGLLLFWSKVPAPTQTRTDFPAGCAARAVASDPKGTIVDHRVAVVIETRRDVVGQRRRGLKNCRDRKTSR